MSKKITHEQARESIEMVDGSFFPTEKEVLLTYIKQQESLVKLVERDTPKKVEVVALTTILYPICPNCKIDLNVDYYKQKYCDNCGQRLDWSEYNE